MIPCTMAVQNGQLWLIEFGIADSEIISDSIPVVNNFYSDTQVNSYSNIDKTLL